MSLILILKFKLGHHKPPGKRLIFLNNMFVSTNTEYYQVILFRMSRMNLGAASHIK